MKARLSSLALATWKLSGEVDRDQAAALVAALDIRTGENPCVDLLEASGGAALLLVLLSWYRECENRGVKLTLTNPSEQLMKVAELSDLHQLLPFTRQTTAD